MVIMDLASKMVFKEGNIQMKTYLTNLRKKLLKGFKLKFTTIKVLQFIKTILFILGLSFLIKASFLISAITGYVVAGVIMILLALILEKEMRGVN
ncbi:hypothetical protein [Enterococcus casseliflavus]|uniref:hypothetical protein n=1 Tax=Enterococcus casseliflavus TaxID=37734 RepID=UPI0039A4A7F3